MLLAVRERGGGPPVVLLHGLFGQARNLGAVQLALSASRRVAAFDLRNHGASPHQRGMDYATLAADVAETMDAIGIPRASLVGHSMGGKVAMRLALDHPERVTSLVVGDIAPVAYRRDYASLIEALRSVDLAPGLTRARADAALAGFVSDLPTRNFLLQNLSFDRDPAWRIGLDEIAAGMNDILDWAETDRNYPGPALFVAGGRSDYIDAACQPAIKGYFPGAQLVTLDDAGHWLHVDKPAEFIEIVTRFLDATELARA